jgi:hypothetical protein
MYSGELAILASTRAIPCGSFATLVPGTATVPPIVVPKQNSGGMTRLLSGKRESSLKFQQNLACCPRRLEVTDVLFAAQAITDQGEAA